jgi:prepilin-type N-terminal cleavage/methylation domain-containing protein
MGSLSHQSTAADDAFTLIELCAVIALIAVLSGFSALLIGGVHARATGARAQGELAVLVQALEAYRCQYGDYPLTAVANEFYESLTGRRGPRGDVLDQSGRMLIETSRFSLRDPNPLAAGNVMLDPWNQPYRYARYTRTANGVISHGYVLFSSGPDGRTKSDDPLVSGEMAGVPDLSDPDNVDNIYANR